MKIYCTYVAKHMCGNKQGQMMTLALPPLYSKPPFSMSTKPPHNENEWDMTWGLVYLQLAKIEFFDVKDKLPFFTSKEPHPLSLPLV